MSDRGAQLMGSYLQVTGRLFPITQVGKLRQGGSAGTRGAGEGGSGPVPAAPSLLSHGQSHLSTKLEAPVQTNPMGYHSQHPPTRLGGMIPGCPRGHGLQALLLWAQARADHQPLPWPPPQDIAGHPATYPCRVPIRAALPSPGWIFLQPGTTGAGNRDCDAGASPAASLAPAAHRLLRQGSASTFPNPEDAPQGALPPLPGSPTRTPAALPSRSMPHRRRPGHQYRLVN